LRSVLEIRFFGKSREMGIYEKEKSMLPLVDFASGNPSALRFTNGICSSLTTGFVKEWKILNL